MFTPDNEKLKTIVFHLLKKQNIAHIADDKGLRWRIDEDFVCIVYIPEQEKNQYKCHMYVYNKRAFKSYEINLTEREAMEIKWQMQSIANNIEESMLNELADFALEENGTQDELLDD